MTVKEGFECVLNVAGTTARLLPEKALYLPEPGVLVAADLHFGKVNHFRRAGLPVPQAATRKNAEMLIDLVNRLKPSRTIFLGDLFHSHYNDDWEVVRQIVRHFPATKFDLVRGNHDILSEQQYIRLGMPVYEFVALNKFILTHEPLERDAIPKDSMNIAGHIHPGARLVGRARQSVVLPCFWRSDKQIVLPAFGSFTGFVPVLPDESDNVYVIMEGKVMEFPGEPSAN